MTCVYVNPRWIRERPTAMLDVAALFVGWMGGSDTIKGASRTSGSRADLAAPEAPTRRQESRAWRAAA